MIKFYGTIYHNTIFVMQRYVHSARFISWFVLE